MTEDYCKGCETPYNCRWCPDNKSKDRCGFCGSEVSTEQAVRTGRLWKELADTKKKLDDLQKDYDLAVQHAKTMTETCLGYKDKLEYAGMILKNLLPHLNGYEKLDVQKALEQKDVK